MMPGLLEAPAFLRSDSEFPRIEFVGSPLMRRTLLGLSVNRDEPWQICAIWHCSHRLKIARVIDVRSHRYFTSLKLSTSGGALWKWSMSGWISLVWVRS